MPFTEDLLTGLASLLAAKGVGTWRATAPYLTTDPTPILVSLSPSSHDQVLTLADYAVSDDPILNDTVTGIQVRSRGLPNDPASCRALEDAVFDVLHGLRGVTLPGGVRVVLCERRSSTPTGVDDNRRHERVSNYYVTTNRPSPNRTD